MDKKIEQPRTVRLEVVKKPAQVTNVSFVPTGPGEWTAEPTIQKPKPKHGGKRPGAGRKPSPETVYRVPVSFRVTPEVKEALQKLGRDWLEKTALAAMGD